jgi:predicted lipoprotein with Yx(FWY)xxD motif
LRALSARRTTRVSLASATIALAIGALAGCGGGSSTTSSGASGTAGAPSASSAAPASGGVHVVAVTVPGLGHVIANSEGKVLYTFAPDKREKVTCVQSCAVVWPPLKLPSGATPTGGGEVKSALLASKPNPEGGAVVTYAGWPLYLYAGDSGPATAKGQALNLNGGSWYVMTPSGQIITKAP